MAGVVSWRGSWSCTFGRVPVPSHGAEAYTFLLACYRRDDSDSWGGIG